MKRHFNYKQLFLSICFLIFILVIIRSWLLPFNHDESATFFFFIQSGNFLPFSSEADANNHILNSALSHLSFRIFGDSPFALRIPNLISLLLLFFATWKLNTNLNNIYSKIILAAGLILSFHWIGFFTLCRGYGISMAFLVLSLAYITDYFKNQRIKDLIILTLCLQLAISANLTLIPVASILFFAILIYQLIKNNLFNFSSISVWLINFILFYFWFSFTLLLRQGNKLYYGSGLGYFDQTFISLTEILAGTTNYMVLTILIIIAGGFLIFSLKDFSIKNFFIRPGLFFSVIILALIIIIFILNKTLAINYPEDRTALFFYPLFIIAVAYTLQNLKERILKPLSLVILFSFIIHFISQVNFSKHSIRMYATFPHFFYDVLKSEQDKTGNKIIIGGHRMSELSYAFMNYRSGGLLNLINPYEKVELFPDYIIANKNDSLIYNKLYNEIGQDKYHNFVLLKRINFIENELLITTDEKIIQGEGEYYNIIEFTDVEFTNKKVLTAEVDFTVSEGDIPLNGWMVFYGEGKDISFYERFPLNWLRYNWNNRRERIILSTEVSAGHFDKILVYFWNINKRTINLKVHNSSIYSSVGED